MIGTMDEYWKFIKHTINPQRKAAKLPKISYTEAKKKMYNTLVDLDKRMKEIK